jgi:hypothetical protein
MTSTYVRVFARGAEEHRGDSLALGAAAYTLANVPKRYAGQSWTVQERTEPEPPPPPPVVASMEQARADWSARLGSTPQVAAEPWRRERVGEPQRAAASAIPERSPDAPPGAAETFWGAYLVNQPQDQQGPPWRRTRTG